MKSAALNDSEEQEVAKGMDGGDGADAAVGEVEARSIIALSGAKSRAMAGQPGTGEALVGNRCPKSIDRPSSNGRSRRSITQPNRYRNGWHELW